MAGKKPAKKTKQETRGRKSRAGKPAALGIRIRLTDDEHALLQQAAALLEQPASAFTRQAALAAAQEVVKS